MSTDISAPILSEPDIRSGDPISPLVTVAPVAKILCLKPNSVYALVRANKIPHVRIGTLVRFNLDVIAEWLSSNTKGLPAEELTRGGKNA